MIISFDSSKNRLHISQNPVLKNVQTYNIETLFDLYQNDKTVRKQIDLLNLILKELVFRYLIHADRDTYRNQFRELLPSKNPLTEFVFVLHAICLSCLDCLESYQAAALHL